MVTDLLQQYVDAGLSIIPVTREKVARGSWKPFQQRRATRDEIEQWCKEGDNFAAIAGRISNNLECIDVDTKNDTTGTLLDDLLAMIELSCDVSAQLIVQRTPSGGAHLIYRCDAVARNQKLAYNELGKCIIETRGEGGYFLISPSTGYTITRGALTNVQTITPDDRERLFEVCRAFNRKVREAQTMQQDTSRTSGKLTSGDDYNARSTDTVDLLVQAGWKIVGTKNQTTFLQRPNKEGRGISATFNFHGNNRLHVFSSNAEPFDSERSYSPFAVYAILKHNGAFKQAARELYEHGYGERDEVKQKPRKRTSSDDDDDSATDSAPQNEVIEYLLANFDFHYNTVTGAYWFRHEAMTDGEWKLLTDYDLNSIWRRCDEERLKVSKLRLQMFIESDLTPRFDPFTTYMMNLPNYDGGDYIEQLAETVLPIVSHQKIWYEYLRKWLVSHVAQVLDNKSNHTALVFRGGQGIGKTTWLNRLCPASLAKNYLYVGDIEAANKDSQILVAEKFIVNLDELESMQRQDIGHLKSLMTTDRISVRRPYARFAETLVRRASFVGSVNRDRFLTDETGNRRFLVVEVDEINAHHSINIDLVWAHALDQYKSGFRYWHNSEDIAEINKLNEEYRVLPVAEQLVEQYLKLPEVCDDSNFLTTTELIEKLSNTTSLRLQVNDYFVRQLGSAIRRAGFERVFRNRRYGYHVTIKARNVAEPDSF